MMIHDWNQPLWAALFERSGAVPHTLLLAGPRGVGKRAFAHTLAQALLCTSDSKVNSEPCGSCTACHLFTARSHPDFRLLEPDSDEEGENNDSDNGSPTREYTTKNILVGQVRALAEFLVITSHLGGRKVVLIQPAERLHASAANALLKTLEDPPADTTFILVTDRAQRLPATMRSRCFRLDFSLPSQDAAFAWLKGQGIEQPDIALAQAGFAPLTALAEARGGRPERRRVFAELLASGDDSGRLAAAADPAELASVCHLLQGWCYDLLSLRLAGTVRYNPDYAVKLRCLADNADVHELQSFAKQLVETTRMLEHPLNPKLVLENLSIRYTRVFPRHRT